MINVALSRAREQLVIVGNRHYLLNGEFFARREVEMFERMLSHALERRG
jgi:superfamily I DNA and/or RNA helicase